MGTTGHGRSSTEREDEPGRAPGEAYFGGMISALYTRKIIIGFQLTSAKTRKPSKVMMAVMVFMFCGG
jgi:hypothetical protein